MPPRRVLGLAALLGGAGVLHFVIPGTYRSIVPAPLKQWDGAIVAASGVAELGCAALLLPRRTRALGALASAALFVAVFPANVQMALDGGVRGAHGFLGSATAAWLRLPLQVPLVVWALWVRRDARATEVSAGGR